MKTLAEMKLSLVEVWLVEREEGYLYPLGLVTG